MIKKEQATDVVAAEVGSVAKTSTQLEIKVVIKITTWDRVQKYLYLLKKLLE